MNEFVRCSSLLQGCRSQGAGVGGLGLVPDSYPYFNQGEDYTHHITEGFICTLSLLISLSITLRSSKFRNQFTIRSKYFDKLCCDERHILILSLLRFSEMTSELMTFNHLRRHSCSLALGTRTGYWKPTRRCTDETPLPLALPDFQTFLRPCTATELQHRMSGFHIHSFTQLEPTTITATQLEFYEVPLGTLS